MRRGLSPSMVTWLFFFLPERRTWASFSIAGMNRDASLFPIAAFYAARIRTQSCLCASSRSAGVGVGAGAGAGALYYSTCQWTRTILRGTRGPDERNRMVARALGHPVRAAGSLLLWREILRSPSSLFSFTVVSATNPLSVSRTHVMTYVASDFGEQRATIDDLIRE